jgi:hypothetical protein
VRAGQGRHAHDIWAEFRHGFSILPPLGTLQIESPMGTMHAQVRLNGAPSDLEVDDATADMWALSIPLAIDTGYWETGPFRKSGNVTVTNSGQVYIWPEIVWEGAGGKVTLPSGAEFTLPAVDSTRRLHLDPQRSHQVLNGLGVRDDDLWRRIRGQIISEGVPPGQSRQYTLPDGAFLEWRIGVLDPWR